jgi:hypothetical protein
MSSQVITTPLFIFKTNLNTPEKVQSIEVLLNKHLFIKRWCIDLEDIDCVLKIEAQGNISEEDICLLLRVNGFVCEVLPD